MHSTASDGVCPPSEVVRRAAMQRLTVIALTDHDTLAGIREAAGEGVRQGVRVIAGCEFSVAAPWGEMHLLAYFLPSNEPRLEAFLADKRGKRVVRAQHMVDRLRGLGLPVSLDEVESEAGTGAVGRPHVARVLVRGGHVADVPEAFSRFLGSRRPAFVPKELPSVNEVTALVRSLGGVTSAAHLVSRATRRGLASLSARGVDGVEVRHPLHDVRRATEIEHLTGDLGMMRTGGTDWHGDSTDERNRAPLGSITIPEQWLNDIEQLHQQRITVEEAG
ncbi:MAG: PHP domain-containing protein [Gemmatimonadota bacterium]|nr:PHP domain-containing protein [Gemmatimonadota bacterium]MDH3366433.1 PHP domain-containing protein [Gemmatimonadota bacterium]MDH5550542.1 PHP domain-containing protein [Gemmatimonadota bacterium]